VKPVIASLNISLPRHVTLDDGRTLHTGLFKVPTEGPVYLDTLGFQGDGSADRVHHGGPDKAVCAYSTDYYAYWEKIIGRPTGFGAFGENLSLSGIGETGVHIGDVFKIGGASVQVSQPRQPCHKLNKVFGLQEMACKVQKTGFSGWYFRVLAAGWVSRGDTLERIEKGVISVEEANDLMHKDKKDAAKLRAILDESALSASWRDTFEKRLALLTPLASSPGKTP
jgi:MOSC domain-containing protein YiiM